MKAPANRIALLLALTLFSAMTALTQFVESQSTERGQSVKLKLPNGEQVDLYDNSYALVIGVSRYTNGWRRLPGVRTDVETVGVVLEQHGFKVTKVTDPDYRQFDEAIRDFIASKGRSRNSRLLIYYAGHGETLQLEDGRKLGYIVPADAPTPGANQEEFFRKAISMDQIEVYAKQVASKHVLFVFDSCFSGMLFVNRNRSVPPSIDSKMLYSVRQFITAGTEDQTVPDESTFRKVFVRGLEGEADLNRDGFVTGSELGSYLEDQVTNYTRKMQTPIYGKIRNPDLDRGDMVFALKREEEAEEETASVRPRRIPPSPPPLQEHVEVQTYTETVNGVGIEMVRIPAGKFLMGSPVSEVGREEDEGPQHQVTISQSFYMGKYEVTQAQWRVVAQLPKVKIDLKANPSNFKGDNLPVEEVNWNEAMEFCDRLSRVTGGKYRLPTEAEWEYACRAGTTGSVAGNIDGMAWYGNNSGNVQLDANKIWQSNGFSAVDEMLGNGCRTHPVGQMKLNAFGLGDTLGNVSEWCMDCYSENYYAQSPSMDPTGPGKGSDRVLRGGNWFSRAWDCRPAGRSSIPSDSRLYGFGFRLAMTSRGFATQKRQ